MPSPDVAPQQHALDRPWTIWASAGVVSFTLISVLLGFVILPSYEESGLSPFAAICRAMGLPGYGDDPAVVRKPKPSVAGSDVVWTSQSRKRIAGGDLARGSAMVAETCSGCHGERGLSADPSFPNLAHQVPEAIFKQLRDYAAGRRTGGQAEIMTSIASTLEVGQMVDVAAYLRSLPPADRVVAGSAVSSGVEDLARNGDTRRGLPACDACHGGGRSGPEETPALLGQSAPYLEAQLKSFAAGERSNDVYGRMRAIAQRLTPGEMHELAIYYGGK
ncbi:MAG: c-type cytochrome [Hansschlegelia sp.]